jgi:hypothetical protein
MAYVWKRQEVGVAAVVPLLHKASLAGWKVAPREQQHAVLRQNPPARPYMYAELRYLGLATRCGQQGLRLHADAFHLPCNCRILQVAAAGVPPAEYPACLATPYLIRLQKPNWHFTTGFRLTLW